MAHALQQMLPAAEMYSTLTVPDRLPLSFRRSVRTTWMQRLPAKHRLYRHYFMLYPFAVAGVDLRAYDLVISSCFGYAKGLRRRPGSIHVCYCHTPPRWIWRYVDYSGREEFGPFQRAVLPHLLKMLKAWDISASRRPDYFIANSHVVARRIEDSYGRTAIVIPPPIDVTRFEISEVQEDYYLVLARLTPYKRIDIAVEACNLLRRRLVIVGDGKDRANLQRLAGPTISFQGRLSDQETAYYVSRCRALLFPGEEDFGMVPLEVAAAGRPTIAYRAGGATETLIDGETGVFFDDQTSMSMADAILRSEAIEWNMHRIRRHAHTFDLDTFHSRLRKFLSSIGVQIPMVRSE